MKLGSFRVCAGSVAAVFAIGASSAGAQQASGDHIRLPAPSGPHLVGTTLFHWVDGSRPEPGTPDPDDARELVVYAWYPAERSDAPAAPYLPLLAEYHAGEILTDAGREILSTVIPTARWGPPPSDVASPLPVLVVSGGNGELAFQYTTLAEELASHGWLVAVLAHPGVAHVAFPDGRILRRYERLHDPKPEGWDAEIDMHEFVNLSRAVSDTFYREAARILAGDVSFVLDRLGELNEGEPDGLRWRGRIDLDRVATYGHSYGGNIALEACERDDRVRACINADGGAFGPTRERGLRKPVLVFRPAFENDGWPRGLAQDQILGSARSAAYEVNIAGAEHRSFMDSRILVPDQAQRPADPLRVLEIVSAYTRAFLNVHAGEAASESALLSRATDRFPEVYLRALHPHFPGDYQQLRASYPFLPPPPQEQPPGASDPESNGDGS